MPIVQAFEGTVEVAGTFKPTGLTLYRKKVDVLSRTSGGLLDGLVAAALTLTEDVFQWCFTANRGGSFPEDSRWLMTTINPRIYDASMGSASPEEEFETVSLTCAESIVQHGVRLRNLQIEEALQNLRNHCLIKPTHRLEEERPLKTMQAEAFSFHDMTTFGLKGTQWDELVSEVAKKGRLTGGKSS